MTATAQLLPVAAGQVASQCFSLIGLRHSTGFRFEPSRFPAGSLMQDIEFHCLARSCGGTDRCICNSSYRPGPRSPALQIVILWNGLGVLVGVLHRPTMATHLMESSKSLATASPTMASCWTLLWIPPDSKYQYSGRIATRARNKSWQSVMSAICKEKGYRTLRKCELDCRAS